MWNCCWVRGSHVWGTQPHGRFYNCITFNYWAKIIPAVTHCVLAAACVAEQLVHWAHVEAAALYKELAASSLLLWPAGCIYREISGLPLAQWPSLVWGLSLSRQAGQLLSKQSFHSAWLAGRPINRTTLHMRNPDDPDESATAQTLQATAGWL